MHESRRSPTHAEIIRQARSMQQHVLNHFSRRLTNTLKSPRSINMALPQAAALQSNTIPTATPTIQTSRMYCPTKLLRLPDQTRGAQAEWVVAKENVQKTFEALNSVQLGDYEYPRVLALYHEAKSVLAMPLVEEHVTAHDWMRLIRTYQRRTQWLQQILVELKSIVEKEVLIYSL